MSRLPIDKMDVGTERALEYFRKNDSKFASMKVNDSIDKHQETPLSDGYNKIIPLVNVTIPEDCKLNYGSKMFDIKFLRLKQLIEKNATVFAQIEYLIRKIPVEDVLNYDIKLIIKNILYATYSVTDPVPHYIDNCLLMYETSPLLQLGFIVQILHKYKTAYIISEPSTAAVCHLFGELCHEAGFGSVVVVFLTCRMMESYTNRIHFLSGCVGVITENADVDSAVDVLLEASVKYPWKLNHILVQESVYNVFIKALQWKTRDFNSESSKKKYCTQVFNYKNKTFLLDYVGSDYGQETTIEAYRTTKELLSMLSKSKYGYMSLWTNNLSESNEISQYSSIDLVWINDYGTFDGPPESSQVVYTNNLAENFYRLQRPDPSAEFVVLLEKQKKWLQLPFSERFEKIFSIICEYNDKHTTYESSLEIMQALKRCKSDGYVSVGNGKVCRYTLRPIKYVFDLTTPVNLPHLVNSLLLGSFVLLSKDIDSGIIKNLIKKLYDAGAPVTIDEELFAVSEILSTNVVTTVKVVYSNYGSIFAN